MITSEEMKEVEKRAEEDGIKPELMMENAGRGLVDVLSQRFDLEEKKVAIACGTGNNGGDGFVVARHLLVKGSKVEVYLYGSPEKIKSKEARMNWNILKNLGVKIRIIDQKDKIPSFEKFDIIVDSILGIGLKGELRGFLPELIEEIKKAKAYKVAVDVPTGLQSDTGEILGDFFKPDLTVTFHKMKPGLKNLEEVVVKNIGVPK